MKIYTYKDGTKAYFVNNEKKVITDEEIKIIYGSVDKMGFVTETIAGDYIAKQIGTNPFFEPRTDKMIKYLHEHKVSLKIKEGIMKENDEKITFELVYENNILVTWRAYNEWGDEISANDFSFSEIEKEIDWQ